MPRRRMLLTLPTYRIQQLAQLFNKASYAKVKIVSHALKDPTLTNTSADLLNYNKGSCAKA